MKKSFIGLLCVSACCLAGCGKGLTTEEACKFADDNWVTGEAAIKEDIECRTEIKVKKATGVFEEFGIEDVDDTDKGTHYASSSETVLALGESGYKFSTFAGKLYADYELDSKALAEELGYEGISEDAIKGSGSSSIIWNKEGFMIEQKSTFDFSIDTEFFGQELKGELSFTEKITYSL